MPFTLLATMQHLVSVVEMHIYHTYKILRGGQEGQGQSEHREAFASTPPKYWLCRETRHNPLRGVLAIMPSGLRWVEGSLLTAAILIMLMQ